MIRAILFYALLSYALTTNMSNLTASAALTAVAAAHGATCVWFCKEKAPHVIRRLATDPKPTFPTLISLGVNSVPSGPFWAVGKLSIWVFNQLLKGKRND